MNSTEGLMSGLMDFSMASVVAGLIAAAVLFRILFSGLDELIESAKYWLMSQRESHHQGMFSEEWWGATKIFFWIAGSFVVAMGVNTLV